MNDIKLNLVPNNIDSLLFVTCLGALSLVSLNYNDFFMGMLKKYRDIESFLLNKDEMLRYLDQVIVESYGKIDYKYRSFNSSTDLYDILKLYGKEFYIILPIVKGKFRKISKIMKSCKNIESRIVWIILYIDDNNILHGYSQPYFLYKGNYMSKDIRRIFESNNSLKNIGINEVSNICYLLGKV